MLRLLNRPELSRFSVLNLMCGSHQTLRSLGNLKDRLMDAQLRGESREFHRSGKSPQASFRAGMRVTKRTRTALSALLQSSEYAKELDRSVWDFAVEISVLRKAGLTNSDLRWLLCKGFVAHGCELSTDSQESRTFRESEKLAFSRRSCFVAKEPGIDFIRSVLDLDVSVQPALPENRPSECGVGHINGKQIRDVEPDGTNGRVEALVPVWDRDRQELRVGNQLVKQFKAPAPNQELILSAFQEDGWPIRIDDPLPPNGNQDPKRRLHDTINSLNRCHKVFLIHFKGDGRASGIRWDLVPRN